MSKQLEFFKANGYIIVKIFDDTYHHHFSHLIIDKLKKINAQSFQNELSDDWQFNDYNVDHISEELHQLLVKPENRYINIDDIGMGNMLCADVKEILDDYWGHHDAKMVWAASLKTGNPRYNAGGYRIARPNTQDVAGIHVDTFFGGVPNPAGSGPAVANLFTLWIPVAGFSELYTLKIAPGSHLVVHPQKDFDDESNYITPSLDPDYENEFEFIRLNLIKGEAIIIHPNLVHGASNNNGTDVRVSVDVRFFDNKNYASLFDDNSVQFD